jgi:hypothetical protein
MALAEKYDRLYDESMPPALGRELLRVLAKHFDETPDFVESHWQGPEAHDLRGYIRRAYIQQDLRSVANRWEPHVTATFERTEKGGSHYTVITAGRLVLTASWIDAPWVMPRSAEFRRQNAETLQLNWLRPSVAPADGAVYAILVYGGMGRRPTFANVAFPDHACEGWLHSVSLREKYPDTWQEIYPEPARPRDPAPTFLRQDDRA